MKILYQVELQRTTLEQMWGFSVEAELIENAERQDELCCYVSRVEDKSVAMHNGKYTRALEQLQLLSSAEFVHSLAIYDTPNAKWPLANGQTSAGRCWPPVGRPTKSTPAVVQL